MKLNYIPRRKQVGLNSVSEVFPSNRSIEFDFSNQNLFYGKHAIQFTKNFFPLPIHNVPIHFIRRGSSYGNDIVRYFIRRNLGFYLRKSPLRQRIPTFRRRYSIRYFFSHINKASLKKHSFSGRQSLKKKIRKKFKRIKSLFFKPWKKYSLLSRYVNKRVNTKRYSSKKKILVKTKNYFRAKINNLLFKKDKKSRTRIYKKSSKHNIFRKVALVVRVRRSGKRRKRKLGLFAKLSKRKHIRV